MLHQKRHSLCHPKFKGIVPPKWKLSLSFQTCMTCITQKKTFWKYGQDKISYFCVRVSFILGGTVPLGAYCTCWHCSCYCLWECAWRLISFVRHKVGKTDMTWGKHSHSFAAKHKEPSCCFPLLFWPLLDPTNQQGSVVTSNLASVSRLLPTDLSFRTTEGGNNKWYSLSQMSKASSSHCCSL